MPGVRFSGGIVLDRSLRAWLSDGPGDEVRDGSGLPGATVVVGPSAASRREVERARGEVRRLVAAGGPLVSAANVDLGGGFRSARLEGGGESRRDAVMAALEVLGPDGVDRVGGRDAVLVALFGAAANRRLGAAAVEALDDGAFSALRLAVAVSDLLHSERIEAILRLRAPIQIEPVPAGASVVLAEELATVLRPYPPARRLRLLQSLWDAVVDCQNTDAARVEARRRRVSRARTERWQREVQDSNGQWWRSKASSVIGPEPRPETMLAWVPDLGTWREALLRTFHESIAATALLRTALASEREPFESAVLNHLEQLAYAATAHVEGLTDRMTQVLEVPHYGGPATSMASAVAGAVAFASAPGASVDRRDLSGLLADQFGNVFELARAVLGSTLELIQAIQRGGVDVGPDTPVGEWRRVAGYTAVRNPRDWLGPWLVSEDRPPLAARAGACEPGQEQDVEAVEDLLWIADLADALAAWLGHDRACIGRFAPGAVDVDPERPAPDPGTPYVDSIPLAVSGAAQLVGVGAPLPTRPRSWPSLVEELVAAGETLALDEGFAVAGEILDWDGRELAETDLRFEVARTPRHLLAWGNYMGNCIAGYTVRASSRFCLVALRDGEGTLVANVSVQKMDSRWRIDQALGRFNTPLSEGVVAALTRWGSDLVDRRPRAEELAEAEPPAPNIRRRRAGSRAGLDRVALQLDQLIREQDTGELSWVLTVLEPIARQLGSERGGVVRDVAVTIARTSPGRLAASTANTLEQGECRLVELWHATTFRPLHRALNLIHESTPGPTLRRLTDPVLPRSLRPILDVPSVRSARVVGLAAVRIRYALGTLLRDAEPRLDRAIVTAPHLGFVTSAILALTARGRSETVDLTWLPVGLDGSLPGRPPSSVTDHYGPWASARLGAQELGAAADRVERVLSEAPGTSLLVPSAWLANQTWAALWSRSHRLTREMARRLQHVAR